ncbi:MAG: hypothetical protein HUU38_28590, partial [Anaerolineales bacterium]|nr:hypothetical protein [Anaerolineales bacterium]
MKRYKGLVTLLNWLILLAIPLTTLSPALTPLARAFDSPEALAAYEAQNTPFATPIVDGIVDASYGPPIASDPADAPQGNLPMDLLDLYITDDANYFYFAYTVNVDIAATNWGKYLFYIDTTNDANGATSDAWGRNVVVTDPHKPEFSINTWVDAQPYGTEDIQFWGWNQGTTSWNSLPAITAAALGTGSPSTIEWQVAKADLGNPSTIWVEVYSTGGGGGDNAQDTINEPVNDWNATDWGTQATLLNSSQYPPPPLVIVDGVIDAAYGDPLASDPPDAPQGNLPMDLLDLYVTDDADNYYVAFTVNENFASTNWGKYILYIDTTNDPNGATSDAWGRNVIVADPHKPEFSLNTYVDAQPYGPEDIQFWGWNQGTTSWNSLGAIPAAALGTGVPSIVEWQIAKADLGNPTSIWLEVYSTGGGGGDNAQDTINDPANDWNATNWSSQATLLNSTEYPAPPPPPTGICTSGADHDNNIFWSDLGHNSRDGLYRNPGGPVVTGTDVTLRLRAACGDLTNAQVRVYNDRLNVQTISNLNLVQQEGQYEWWEITLPASELPTVYWYRFIAQDGTATAYYEDEAARNGGWGQTVGESQDNSWQLTHYDPNFHTPDWVKNAVVYQIFTDRFNDGDPTNNTPAGSFFYNETTTIIRSNATDWNTPICDPRDAASDCPGVYSQNFYGGDLQGIINKLDYLETLGVTALYLNPIFESPSNHKYDTTDFSVIDDNFGDLALFQTLVTQAGTRGMSVILDGVFNHTSSDSIYFDRYGRYAEVGACESETSPYREWYYFTDVTPGTGPCVGSDGTPEAATYTSWFGFDSLPKLNANIQAVRDLIWDGGSTSIARFWVEE